MLHPLCVASRLYGLNAQGQQEREHDLVTPTTLRCELFALGCQSNRAIRLRHHQAFLGQTRDGANNGDMRNTHMPGQVLDPAFTLAVDDVRNPFDIVFGGLCGMVRTDLSEAGIGNVLNNCHDKPVDCPASLMMPNCSTRYTVVKNTSSEIGRPSNQP